MQPLARWSAHQLVNQVFCDDLDERSKIHPPQICTRTGYSKTPISSNPLRHRSARFTKFWGEHPIDNSLLECNLNLMNRTNSLFWKSGLLSIGVSVTVLFTGCKSGSSSTDLNHSPNDSDSSWGRGNQTQPSFGSPTVTPANQTFTPP
jgi:hypothetical protein